MELDELADVFFSEMPPLDVAQYRGFGLVSALSEALSSSALLQTVSELHVQLRDQFREGIAVIEQGLVALRDQHEKELADLIETTGRDVAVVHSETTESVIVRHTQEIEAALLEQRSLSSALEFELRNEFHRFIRVSASAAASSFLPFSKNAACLVCFGIKIPCLTVKVPNPLRGALPGARPKDPALSPIVLDVSPRRFVSDVMDLGDKIERHKEHFKRLVLHRFSVMVITDPTFKLPTSQPELLLVDETFVTLMPTLSVKLNTYFWGANFLITPEFSSSSSLDVEAFRNILSFSFSVSADMLSIVFSKEHFESELQALIESVAASQVDVGAGRLTNAWGVTLGAFNSSHGDTIQSQPFYSFNKQPFNLPLSIRVFVPTVAGGDEGGELRKMFHRSLQGRGLEWFGDFN